MKQVYIITPHALHQMLQVNVGAFKSPDGFMSTHHPINQSQSLPVENPTVFDIINIIAHAEAIFYDSVEKIFHFHVV